MLNRNSITRKILPHHKQKTNKRDDKLQLKKITGKNKQNSSIGLINSQTEIQRSCLLFKIYMHTHTHTHALPKQQAHPV